jgi:RNA polymerase sigma-70 factor (ECF subfamily)
MAADPVAEEPVAVDVPPRFEDFYRQEYPRLVRMVASMTHRWSVAEELAQESLWEASRRWGDVGAMERPDAWVRRVAVRRAVSWHRRLLAEASALGRARPERPRDSDSAVVDPAIWAALRSLPRRQAVAMALWGIEQRSFEEIGEVLGCSAETARTHVRRARTRLEEALWPRT